MIASFTINAPAGLAGAVMVKDPAVAASSSVRQRSPYREVLRVVVGDGVGERCGRSEIRAARTSQRQTIVSPGSEIGSSTIASGNTFAVSPGANVNGCCLS